MQAGKEGMNEHSPKYLQARKKLPPPVIPYVYFHDVVGVLFSFHCPPQDNVDPRSLRNDCILRLCAEQIKRQFDH